MATDYFDYFFPVVLAVKMKFFQILHIFLFNLKRLIETSRSQAEIKNIFQINGGKGKKVYQHQNYQSGDKNNQHQSGGAFIYRIFENVINDESARNKNTQ